MAQRRGIRRVCVALVGGIVLGVVPMAGGGTPVEELTRRLPEGTLGFVATGGGAALKGDFAKTALGKIWNDPNVQSFYQALKTELLAKAKEQAKGAEALQKADLVTRYARLALGRPLLVGVARTQVKEGPPICAFAIVDAGDRKSDIVAAVSKLETLAGADAVVDTDVGSLKMRKVKERAGLPLYWGWVENYLVIAGNDPQGAVAKALTAPRATVSYLAKVPATDDALVAYFDNQGLMELAGALDADGRTRAHVLRPVLQGLGLVNSKVVARVGFAGEDLVAQALFQVPMPPTGVFAAYRPVDPAWLGAVDIRAVTATALNLDAGGLYDTILNTLKTVSPDQGYLQIRKGIVDFETTAKLRIREGLFASLAGPALFYSLPAGPVTEAPRGGLVLVAKLKDAALFEKTMTALGEFAGGQSKGTLQITAQTREGGRTVHVWTVAQLMLLGVMPAWSVANDHVVIGSSVELCDLGVKQLVSQGADGKSLLDAPGYQKVAAGLPKGMVTFSYTDSGVQLTQTLMQIQQFWPFVTMAAMQAGIKLPVTLPSLTKIAKDLGPSCSYRYFGPDGLHAYYRGTGIEATEMTIAGAAVGAGIALPAIVKNREQTRSARSMSNLKHIGQALVSYAEDHQGNLPADLEQTKPYLGEARVFDSPRKPKEFDGPSYIYVAGQTTKMDSHNVVAYENPGYCTDRINVLFLDEHVEAMKPEAFRDALKATYERLGKPMPEIRFKGETEVKPRVPRPARPGQSTQT